MGVFSEGTDPISAFSFDGCSLFLATVDKSLKIRLQIHFWHNNGAVCGAGGMLGSHQQCVPPRLVPFPRDMSLRAQRLAVSSAAAVLATK